MDEDSITRDSLLRPARVDVAGRWMRQKGINVYRCPRCMNLFRHDDEYEPVCSGPGATDSHELTVMEFVGVTPIQMIWAP